MIRGAVHRQCGEYACLLWISWLGYYEARPPRVGVGLLVTLCVFFFIGRGYSATTRPACQEKNNFSATIFPGRRTRLPQVRVLFHLAECQMKLVSPRRQARSMGAIPMATQG